MEPVDHPYHLIWILIISLKYFFYPLWCSSQYKSSTAYPSVPLFFFSLNLAGSPVLTRGTCNYNERQEEIRFKSFYLNSVIFTCSVGNIKCKKIFISFWWPKPLCNIGGNRGTECGEMDWEGEKEKFRLSQNWLSFALVPQQSEN